MAALSARLAISDMGEVSDYQTLARAADHLSLVVRRCQERDEAENRDHILIGHCVSVICACLEGLEVKVAEAQGLAWEVTGALDNLGARAAT